MIGWLLRLSGRLAMLMAGIVVVIRGQPFDDGGLRETLFTPECSPPCFLGIRPGVTTADEALAILQAHPWVAEVNSNYEAMQIWWNGEQPRFLGSRQQPAPFNRSYIDGNIDLQAGIVSQVQLFTQLDLGTALNILGQPDGLFYEIVSIASFGPYPDLIFGQDVIYSDDQLDLLATTLCPLRPDNQWRILVSIYMPPSASPPATHRSGLVPLPRECR